MELYNPEIKFSSRSMTFNLDHYITYCLYYYKLVTIYSYSGQLLKKMAPVKDIVKISAYTFIKIAESSKNKVIAIWPEYFEQLEKENEDLAAAIIIDVAVITANDYEKFFSKLAKHPITKNELRKKVPATYYEYLDV